MAGRHLLRLIKHLVECLGAELISRQGEEVLVAAIDAQVPAVKFELLCCAFQIAVVVVSYLLQEVLRRILHVQQAQLVQAVTVHFVLAPSSLCERTHGCCPVSTELPSRI